jgi:hypothetical protein
LGFGQSGPGNPESVGYERLARVLQEATDEALSAAGISREMIAGAFPHLSAEEQDMLARGTSGLAGQEVLDAVRDYLEAGRPPGRVWDGETCPLDPVNGYYIEHLLDPLELGRQIRRRGFRVTVRPYFGGARGGLVHLANELLTRPRLAPIMLRFTPSFRILARKEDG